MNMARQIYDAMQPEGVGYEVHYITTYPKYNQISRYRKFNRLMYFYNDMFLTYD